jgi:hypothetical protein
MARRNEEIAGFQFRLGAVLAVRFCLQWFFVWTMIWATAVVLLRVLWRVEVPTLLWGALGYLPAAAVAVLIARRWVPNAVAVRALLDRHGAMGGLVMAAGETEIGDWRPQIARLSRPAVRLQARLHGGMLFCAAGLLAAGLLVPENYLPATTLAGQSLELDDEVHELAEKIELLKGEGILPQEKSVALEKDVQELRQEASARDPAKTMEAIDHLEQSFQNTAEEAGQEAMQQAQRSSRAGELADALQQCQNQMDGKQFDEAMKELSRMTDQAAGDSESLREDLGKQLKEACKSGKLTAKQLEQLSKALKHCKACEREKLAKMADARLIDPADLIACDKACQGDPEKLAQCLKDCKEGDDLAALLAEGDNSDSSDNESSANTDEYHNPAKGGRRGGGPTSMTWQKGVETAGAAFKESILPPAAVASFEKSRLIGRSVGQPTAATGSQGSSGGALDGARLGAGGARTHVILPEHQRTVSRYFSREDKK